MKTINRTTHALVIKAEVTASGVPEIIMTGISKAIVTTWANDNWKDDWKENYKVVPISSLPKPIIYDTSNFPVGKG